MQIFVKHLFSKDEYIIEGVVNTTDINNASISFPEIKAKLINISTNNAEQLLLICNGKAYSEELDKISLGKLSSINSKPPTILVAILSIKLPPNLIKNLHIDKLSLNTLYECITDSSLVDSSLAEVFLNLQGTASLSS